MHSEGGFAGIIEGCKRTKSNSTPVSWHRHTDDGCGQPLFQYVWSVQTCAIIVVCLKFAFVVVDVFLQ